MPVDGLGVLKTCPGTRLYLHLHYFHNVVKHYLYMVNYPSATLLVLHSRRPLVSRDTRLDAHDEKNILGCSCASCETDQP
jgi:hypothetical protein